MGGDSVVQMVMYAAEVDSPYALKLIVTCPCAYIGLDGEKGECAL